MEGKFSSQSPATRRQLLLTCKAENHRKKPENASTDRGRRSDLRSRMGETAGECTAVCCCCPCAAVHFFLVAAYCLPKCLWRRKKRNSSRNQRSSSDETEMNQRKMSTFGLRVDDDESTHGGEDHGAKTEVVVAWENEIWKGFWRSSSRRMNDE